jgi:hypothetical protein
VTNDQGELGQVAQGKWTRVQSPIGQVGTGQVARSQTAQLSGEQRLVSQRLAGQMSGSRG